jgi:hypothetical protein
MARRIQSQSDGPQASIGAFLKLLTGGVGWLFMATFVPIQALLDDFPALAPYAHWAPILFYILAFWTFSRAVLTLQRVARGRTSPGLRGRKAGARTGARTGARDGALGGDKPSADARRAKSSSGLPVVRTPTVQRMR